MTMYRHQPFTVQGLKQHPMTEIGRSNRVFLLYPWSIQGSAFRISHSLSVHIINPTSPNHTESTCSCTEQIRTVSDFIRFILAIRIFFTAPRRFAGTEQ